MKTKIFILLLIIAAIALFSFFYFRKPRCRKICFSTGEEDPCALICNGPAK